LHCDWFFHLVTQGVSVGGVSPFKMGLLAKFRQQLG